MNNRNSNVKSHHTLILTDNHSRRLISLDSSKYYLGRHRDNSIILHSRQASRRHATLMRKFDQKTNQE
ncbi:MAG: FHA domain-containing protein, partial [Cyanobacteria bacterium P01_G01_bin.49]